MKKLKLFLTLLILTVGLTIVGCESPTSINDPQEFLLNDAILKKLVIGQFFAGGKIFFKGQNFVLIADISDLVPQKNWTDAKIACREKGKGWILPDIEQLKLLYKNKSIVGNFADNVIWSIYWSSSLPDGPDSVWWAQIVDFERGPSPDAISVTAKIIPSNVRAIKKIFINYKISYDK